MALEPEREEMNENTCLGDIQLFPSGCLGGDAQLLKKWGGVKDGRVHPRIFQFSL